jgi:hypothetical protein
MKTIDEAKAALRGALALARLSVPRNKRAAYEDSAWAHWFSFIEKAGRP